MGRVLRGVGGAREAGTCRWKWNAAMKMQGMSQNDSGEAGMMPLMAGM